MFLGDTNSSLQELKNEMGMLTVEERFESQDRGEIK